MPRKFSPLVMTKIRWIAHPSRDAECIARLLLMQVILVCVVNAAQKTWVAGRVAGDDRSEEQVPGGTLSPLPAGTLDDAFDPSDSPGIPLRVLWECIAVYGGLQEMPPAGTFLLADTGSCRRSL